MRTLATLFCVSLAACGGVVSSEDMPIKDRTWTLLASSADEGLVDVQHPELGTYPNPKGLKSMTVTLEEDGRLCARDSKRSWCGGPIQGIPYSTVLRIRDASYCVRVLDIYGNEVRGACKDGPAPVSYTSGTPNLVGPAPDGSNQTADDRMQGAELMIAAINASLAKIGLKTKASVPPPSGLADFGPGDITLGKATCEDVQDYLKSEFSDDSPDGKTPEDYVFGKQAIAECLNQGRCRIAQLVTRAMAEACTKIPEGGNSYQFQQGIVGGGGAAVGQLCQEGGEISKCVGSPLVLDLAGDGLQLKGLEAGASFPLFGTQLSMGWLAGSDDALLAIDLDGDGRITSGRELFGEASGGWAANGFAALARHDENQDGIISSADSVFGRLLAWRDNGDGRCAPEELAPLTALGITSISLARVRSAQVDAFGNELGLVGAASTKQGKAVPVIDVWFRIQRQGVGSTP